jgi:hypothetical protein
MYARAHLFSIRGIRRAIGLMAGVGACALISGCVGNPFENAQVDPTSPVAAEVARVANTNRPYPTFASIPSAPKDVRAPRQYGRAASEIEAARNELEQNTAPETWSLKDTEAFAEDARKVAGSEAPPRASSAESADFAARQRKRATPPPPPKDH